MSIIKNILFITFIILITFTSKTFADDLKKVGKYKDWEVMVMNEASGKVLSLIHISEPTRPY